MKKPNGFKPSKTQIAIRLPPHLFEKIAERAVLNERSFNAEASEILEIGLAHQLYLQSLEGANK